MAPPPNSGDANNKNDDDPLGGMDPMAWLESLAARQGAKPEELTTAADLDIPVLPADTVIDEPGYTPGYDTGKSTAKAEPVKAAPPPEPAKVAPPPQPESQPVAQAAAADDPLGGMDPMAWLESLAARQGAKAEELTTAANLDIPVLPADTVIDEPGYTPGYDTGKPAAKAEPAKATPPPPQPEPQPVAKLTDEETMAMDPMAWLESLAARQGAKPEELMTAHDVDIPVLPADTVIDEPGYTPGYDTGKPAAKAEPAKPEPVKAKAEPEPVAPPPPPPAPTPEPARAESIAASADPFSGMDPMAWLESLAARQGAKAEELTTAANLDIPMPPADSVIDEPGYVDYDPFGGNAPSRAAEPSRSSTPAAPPPAAPTPEPVAAADPLAGVDPLSWLESLSAEQTTDVEDFFGVSATTVEVTQPQEEAQQPASMSAAEAAELLGIDETAERAPAQDPLGGVDPLAWLESLAARQGANLDELVTGGTMDLPPAPTGEQGDEEYSPFAATSQSSSASMEPESALNWLEELAAEQGAAATAMPQGAGSPAAQAAEAGGMSNDINEVQAWLEAQARNLELTRQDLESEPIAEELPPAEPASELPSWLRESMPSGPSGTPSQSPALRDDIAVPVAPSDLPSWLVSPENEPVPEFGDDLIRAIRETGTMPAVAQPSAEPAETLPASPAELESLTRPTSPDKVDSWAEALDEEYERRVAGDESVPDWYQEALARASSEIPAVREAQIAPTYTPAEEEQPEVDLAPSGSAMPDWLQEMAPNEEPAEALPGEIPDWLRNVAPELPTAAATVTAASDDWLNQTVEDADIPDWLKPAAPEPAPAQAQQAAPPAPAPTPAPAPVQAQAPAPQAQPKPQPTPQPVQQPRPAPRPAVSVVRAAGPAGPEHHGRLKQARELVASNQHPASLEHYQLLIDASQLLEETRGDLRQLVESNPSDPRIRRLLGDTHMRLGDLQAALDTYRSALDQL